MHEITTLLGNLNYVFIILAFLMRNMLSLRLLTIASSLCALLYYLYHLATPLWVGVYWESAFILINIVQVTLLLYERRKVVFTKEAQEIYQTVFSHFLPAHFDKLLKISTFADAEKGDILIQQGAQVAHLLLIYRGLVSISINGKTVNYCGAGDLLGEMSFLSGNFATATAQAIQPTKYVMWLQKDLRKLLQNNPEMMSSMQTVFNKDFIKKLTISPEEKASALL